MTDQALQPATTGRTRSCRWCHEDDVEFGWYSAVLAEVLPTTDRTTRLAAACRGSGDRPVLARAAAALSALRPRELVVDVGAGLGGPAAWLEQETGLSVLALEPSEPSIRTARTVLEGVRIVPGDAQRLPLPDRVAAGLLMIGVLSVAGDVDAALDEAVRVLRPGGVLVVTDVVRAPGHRPHGLPDGTRPLRLGELAHRLAARGVRVTEAGEDTAPRDDEWADLRDEVDDLVTRHVERTPHGTGAACPVAWQAERDDRGRLQDALGDGTLVRETFVGRV